MFQMVTELDGSAMTQSKISRHFLYVTSKPKIKTWSYILLQNTITQSLNIGNHKCFVTSDHLFQLFHLSSSFFLCLIFNLHQCRTYTTPVNQMSVEGATDCGPEHQTVTQMRVSLNVWSSRCQDHRQRQHRTEYRQRTHNQSQDRN